MTRTACCQFCPVCMAWHHGWSCALTHPTGQRDFPLCAFTPLSVVPVLLCRRRQQADHTFCHVDRHSGICFPLVTPQQLQNLPSLFLACGVEVWICSEEGQGLCIAVECGSCTVFCLAPPVVWGAVSLNLGLWSVCWNTK